MESLVSILLADDHALVRGMLASRLDAEPDFCVVASCTNAGDAAAEAIRLGPDIILMDIDMPGLNCFEAAENINRHHPETRIIFVSGFTHDRYIEQAMAVNGWGYVTKGESEETLIHAIRKVASGVAYYSPDVRARLVISDGGATLVQSHRSRVSALTDRELEVLRYLARGLSKKKIAETLHISVNTVNRHSTAVMNKLDIHDRVELARFAIREGLAEA